MAFEISTVAGALRACLAAGAASAVLLGCADAQSEGDGEDLEEGALSNEQAASEATCDTALLVRRFAPTYTAYAHATDGTRIRFDRMDFDLVNPTKTACPDVKVVTQVTQGGVTLSSITLRVSMPARWYRRPYVTPRIDYDPEFTRIVPCTSGFFSCALNPASHYEGVGAPHVTVTLNGRLVLDTVAPSS